MSYTEIPERLRMFSLPVPPRVRLPSSASMQRLFGMVRVFVPRSSTDTSPPVRMQASLGEETSGLVSSPSSVTATGAPYPLRLMKVAPLPERTVSSVSV